MAELNWVSNTSYIVPLRTADGSYQVVRRVGGKRGPVFQAQFVAGMGVAGNLEAPQDLIEDAQQLCQHHADENARQNACAARSSSI